ncbi:coxsackievirus and adenovirus receptor homolog [Odontesthes bonariensis]|uniref:coxsackievirus and adenovirus receptor homolog n=1 Tax=Odontesthes bonariensis TaxID=219752 RepID=UPI003F58545E
MDGWGLVPTLLTLLAVGLVSAPPDQEITTKPGQDVILTFGAPNNSIPIEIIEWSRADLEPEYVLYYKEEKLVYDDQHPSFKDRVYLQDRQMTDGNMSLILKNVTTNDSGTYECRVQRENIWDKIGTISLKVPPAGKKDGRRDGGGAEDGGAKGGGNKGGGAEGDSLGLIVGLPVGLPVIATVLIVGV